jgi:glycerophosphoryl diester phosphodiesterase
MMPTPPLRPSQAARPVAISAHRGGSERAPEGTHEAYQDALEAGADYLEFDVRRTADGELVAFHGAQLRPGGAVSALSYVELCRMAGYAVPTTSGLLSSLAGRARAHIDLKDADCLGVIVAQARSALTSERVVVTTGDERAISELRRRYPEIPGGLTIGGPLVHTARYLARRARIPIRSPVEAAVDAGANWAAVRERLARVGALADCRSRGLATMVWTVNDEAALARWLTCPDVDVVVTDRPRRALALRDSPPPA